LTMQIAMLPTPRGSIIANSASSEAILNIKNPKGNLEEVIGGRIGNHPGMRLQPAFVEWMMGLPIGWTDLNA